jgi:hypothetical protein
VYLASPRNRLFDGLFSAWDFPVGRGAVFVRTRGDRVAEEKMSRRTIRLSPDFGFFDLGFVSD